MENGVKQTIKEGEICTMDLQSLMEYVEKPIELNHEDLRNKPSKQI